MLLLVAIDFAIKEAAARMKRLRKRRKQLEPKGQQYADTMARGVDINGGPVICGSRSLFLLLALYCA